MNPGWKNDPIAKIIGYSLTWNVFVCYDETSVKKSIGRSSVFPSLRDPGCLSWLLICAWVSSFFHHALSHNINLTNQKKPGEFENAFIFKNLTAHPKLSFQKPANPLPPSGLPRQWLGSIGADFLNYTDFVRMLLLHMSDVVVVAGKQSCEAIKHENVFIHAVIGSVCWGTVWESLPGKANKTKQNKTKPHQKPNNHTTANKALRRNMQQGWDRWNRP